MIPLNVALAAVLITAPGPDPVPSQLEHLSVVRTAVRDVSLGWEILDPRETRLTRYEDFSFDLHFVRNRWHDFKNAPPLYDCMRFPGRESAEEALSFNCAYRQHLCDREMLEPFNQWALYQAIQETDMLFRVWNQVLDCRCDYYYVTVRRAALQTLKEKLGDQAYCSGLLPPYVPVWQFQRINP